MKEDSDMKRLLPASLLLVVLGCSSSTTPTVETQPQTVPDPHGTPGLHNVQVLSPQLITGSSPEGDEGFQTLKSLGVRTIITVDGARPDVERARKFDMRYVHLPISYDGVPREQALRIARAIRDLPCPIYLHCHHGKHRAPAAAATARLCLDDRCGVDDAIEGMKRSGTDPHYTGLYASPRELKRPTKEELDRVLAEFPEVSPIPPLAEAMVHLEEHWDRLTAIRAAGWKVPRTQPDLDPPHEALQLREGYHEMSRMIGKKSDEFQRWLRDAEMEAGTLEKLLRQKEPDTEAIEKSYRTSQQACKQCHLRYRDVPQSP